jgi:hypothetical protein
VERKTTPPSPSSAPTRQRPAPGRQGIPPEARHAREVPRARPRRSR